MLLKFLTVYIPRVYNIPALPQNPGALLVSVLCCARYCRILTEWCNHLGVVACSCNLATWRVGEVNGLRSGDLWCAALCRSGVRTKPGVNMVAPAEARETRLTKEGRTGSGWKHSSQKSPRWAVVGSHLWIGSALQPDQHSWTLSF